MLISSYLLMVLSVVVICVIYYFIFIMGAVSFYEFAYMLSHNMAAGGAITVAWDTIKPCLWLAAVLFIILFLLNKYVFKGLKSKLVFSIILLILSLLTLLKVVKIDEYILSALSKTKVYEEYYVDTNNVNIEMPEDKRNLIVIYLESMEASLFSKENGGAFEKSIIPELEEIALNNTSFSNTDKLGGAHTLTKTTFTISSFVASTSGTPINIKLFKGYNSKRPFMRSVRTLGNVLKDNGYNLEIMQGSEIEFSATDLYIKENEDFKVFDINTAKNKGLIDKNYFVWWGIEDKKVLEFSKDEILELSKQNEPFAFVLFTMDTHFKDGYLDETCDKPFKEHLANSYACSSKMINEYLNWLKEQDFYENTTIVLMGDHQVMQDSFYKDHKEYDRVNYNAIINSVASGNTKNREFSQFDMYPTILASMGASIEGNRLGFGANLYSEEKTMLEILGKDKFDKEILKKSEYYDKNILTEN